jgi:hypothetical protein
LLTDRLVENNTNKITTSMARTKSYLSQPVGSIDFDTTNGAVEKLITEGGEAFYNYVDTIGLSDDSNLIVLSSQHHYFFDSEEISKAKTVINLKELNKVKELKSFLHSHLHFLPRKCNFVGCFVNNNKVERYALRKNSTYSERRRSSDSNGLGITSKFPFINMLYSLMDLKTNSYMSEESVTLMLGENGFKVIDMTDRDGITFFHSQKVAANFN